MPIPISYARVVDGPASGPVAHAVECEEPATTARASAVRPSTLTLEERVAAMQNELDLPFEIVTDLLSLAGAVDIVVIADDSSSMNAVVDATNPRQPSTRWDELRSTLTRLVRMLLVVEHVDGFTLKFLNESEYRLIDSSEALAAAFAAKPIARGGTPLLANLQPVCDRTQRPSVTAKGAEHRPMIVIVMTDGQPSDTNMEGITRLLKRRDARDTYFTFAMCTENDAVVDAYNRAVDPCRGCDVSDDYESEKKEVEACGGKLSHDKWLAKIVLGGLMPKYDRMDDPRRSTACAIS